MARITDGINGGLSGKVGDLVFYTMNGGKYVRSLPSRKRKKTPPTPRQALQRARFAAIQEWLRPIKFLVKESFRNYAPRQTGHNAAMSYNLKNSVVPVGEGFEVNAEEFMFSVGPLAEADRPTAIQEGDVVRFHWQYEVVDLTANPRDRTMLLLYRIGRPYSEYRTFGKERIDCSDALSIREYVPGDVCHAYIAFISAENLEVSNSVYIGMLEIQAY